MPPSSRAQRDCQRSAAAAIGVRRCEVVEVHLPSVEVGRRACSKLGAWRASSAALRCGGAGRLLNNTGSAAYKQYVAVRYLVEHSIISHNNLKYAGRSRSLLAVLQLLAAASFCLRCCCLLISMGIAAAVLLLALPLSGVRGFLCCLVFCWYFLLLPVSFPRSRISSLPEFGECYGACFLFRQKIPISPFLTYWYSNKFSNRPQEIMCCTKNV